MPKRIAPHLRQIECRSVSKMNADIERTPTHWLNEFTRKGRWKHLKRLKRAMWRKRKGYVYPKLPYQEQVKRSDRTWRGLQRWRKESNLLPTPRSKV